MKSLYLKVPMAEEALRDRVFDELDDKIAYYRDLCAQRHRWLGRLSIGTIAETRTHKTVEMASALPYFAKHLYDQTRRMIAKATTVPVSHSFTMHLFGTEAAQDEVWCEVADKCHDLVGMRAYTYVDTDASIVDERTLQIRMPTKLLQRRIEDQAAWIMGARKSP